MAGAEQKMKILYLMKIITEQTDENHIMSANDLAAALAVYGISAERKSIYSDIEALQTFGMDIVQQKGANAGYYLAGREFELAELASKSEASQLNRQVFILNRPKTGNETIYYSVDDLHRAISVNRKITFQYAEWTEKKKLRLKHDGAYYIVSPWALTWDDENYYLIAYDEKAEVIKHYRVDKMLHINLLDQERLGEEHFKNFDLAAFAKKTFGMYGGRDESVTLTCCNELAGVILDRFGSDIMMIPSDRDHFHVNVTVSVSRQFFGWVTGVGSKMQLDGPVQVRQEYLDYLKEILGNYCIQND
jgi:predicted DNA-binding transcriptional regulator YafY